MKIRGLVLIVFLAAFLACGCYRSSGSVLSPAPAHAASPRVTVIPPPKVGFYSPEKLREHFSKHGVEVGAKSADDYLTKAVTLRDAPIGGSILEVIRADTVRTRFDRGTGDFIAFDKDKTIRTFFHPGDGERYFRRQATRP